MSSFMQYPMKPRSIWKFNRVTLRESFLRPGSREYDRLLRKYHDRYVDDFFIIHFRY